MTRVTPKHWIQPSGTIFHLCFRWRIRFLNGKLWSCVPGLGAAGKLMSPVPVPFIIWLAWRNHHKTSFSWCMSLPAQCFSVESGHTHSYLQQSRVWTESDLESKSTESGLGNEAELLQNAKTARPWITNDSMRRREKAWASLAHLCWNA